MASLFVGNLSFVLTDAELECWFESTGYPVEPDHVTTDRKSSFNRASNGRRVNRVPPTKASTQRNMDEGK